MSSVIDLDFKLNNSLDLGLYIEIVCCKALKINGSDDKMSKDFKLGQSIKILFLHTRQTCA